ncbi:MAG: CBS domain-containing protein [Parasphingopyxis sp.]|uniref:CBS domain-containing protein n=1 Tax=Parasphingopyxis sp. TaxID=1920299 RepID=UPI0032ED90F1
MKINEIMSRDVELVAPDTSIREAACKMRDEDVGALPVGEDNRLKGMITDRDIVVRGVAAGEANDGATVGDVMSGDMFYCYEDDDVEGAADSMAENQIRRLPVLNREKRLVGIVALADISRSNEGEGGSALEDISQPSEKAHA